MIKRIVIAECRNYNNYEEAKKYIDFCISNIRQEGTKKWQRYATMLFVFGTKKAKEQNL